MISLTRDMKQQVKTELLGYGIQAKKVEYLALNWQALVNWFAQAEGINAVFMDTILSGLWQTEMFDQCYISDNGTIWYFHL